MSCTAEVGHGIGWIGRRGGDLFCEGIIKGKNGLRFCIICSVQYEEVDVHCEWVWTRDCCWVSCCCLKLGKTCGESVPMTVYPMASRSPKRENQEIQGDLSSLC